jgi:Tol biopolymer transport system component
MKRSAIVAGLGLAMLLFSLGVYHAAGLLKTNKQMVHRPNEISARALPGTMYLVQAGAIYRFQNGSFKQITPEDGWTQPSLSPANHGLVAAQRHTNWSDLFLLSNTGRKIAQLTHNQSSPVEANHWSFYPRFSSDGSTLFYDYDPKDPYNGYRVDLAIFASPSSSNWQKSVQWTTPNDYTGGDVDPVPLPGGGLVYTKFSVDGQSKLHSEIWVQARAESTGVALTQPDLDCLQPAISPNQKLIAMVCTKGQTQMAELDVAPFDSATHTVGLLSTLVKGQLVASPSFSPDGKTIAFLAPVTSGGRFQLWTVGASGNPSPHALTMDVGLDSLSPPVWVGS